MRETTAIERIVRRDRLVAAVGLTLIVALAWSYLLSGGGMGTSTAAMTAVSLFPHTLKSASGIAGMDGMLMPGASWSFADALLVIAMWCVMMVAMMLPSAAPMILLHARVARRAAANGADGNGALRQTAAFTAGYLLAWFAFSVLATTLQWVLQDARLLSGMTLWSQNAWFSAAALCAAGLYQWTPLKNACLSHCRGPAEFLSRHWRPGRAGAVRLGVSHGAYCIGCCWALMALLFVGGVMNPVWIAALAVVVLAEKLLPFGLATARAGGAVLIAWGIATLAA